MRESCENMVSVAETEKLLTEILGAPIKAVAYAKGYKTSTGKVLAIHPTQKAPRIWYQPPVAPQMAGVSNIPPAKNDDLVGELAVLRKGHDTPRVQIETAKGLHSFLAWYDGTATSEVSSELEAPIFSASATRFQDLVRRKSNHPFKGFDEGLIAAWENYKPRLRDTALSRLSADAWREQEIGSGVILEHVIDAIEIQSTHGDGTNNLVFWQNRFGHANRDHRA